MLFVYSSCFYIFSPFFFFFFFFFNDTATTEIYTLSLHDALPISCFSLCAHPAAGISRAQATVLNMILFIMVLNPFLVTDLQLNVGSPLHKSMGLFPQPLARSSSRVVKQQPNRTLWRSDFLHFVHS